MIGSAIERHPGAIEPAQRVGERRAIRVADGKVIEARRSRRRRLAAGALPRVQGDVMVIATSTQEGRGVAHALRDGETQHAVIERERTLEIGDLEVDVPDIYSWIDGVVHCQQ